MEGGQFHGPCRGREMMNHVAASVVVLPVVWPTAGDNLGSRPGDHFHIKHSAHSEWCSLSFRHSRTGIYRVHITLHLHRVGVTLHLLVSVVQLLTGVIAMSTNGTGNISMTVCSLVCSTEPQVEKWMWTGYLATLLLIEHSNSRFDSLCKSIRFVKNRPFDSLVVMQFLH